MILVVKAICLGKFNRNRYVQLLELFSPQMNMQTDAHTNRLDCITFSVTGGGYNYDSTSIPLRPFDDQRYDQAAALLPN